VLGLDRGGSCRGIAYRVAGSQAEAALSYLWARELVTRVYVPRRVRLHLSGGPVEALAFTVDRTHPQYCGGAGADAILRLIRQGVGVSGRNLDYLLNTVAHLRELGIHDAGLEALARHASHPE